MQMRWLVRLAILQVALYKTLSVIINNMSHVHLTVMKLSNQVQVMSS